MAGVAAMMERSGPLAGIRVLELGNFIAGPFCASILGSFGAEVIKIEPPGGDQIRRWRELDSSGTSLWWRSLARNKYSVCIDMRHSEGRSIVKELIGEVDCLVENFRPGRMEKWGLGPLDVKDINPSLVYTRVSGYGQTGPLSSRAGFASACEAMGGLRYVTGIPGQMSVRSNISIGDSLAGSHAAMGSVLALLAKERSKADNDSGIGQIVDSSIVESVFSMMEGVLPEYSGAGVIREPSGTSVTGIVPTGTFTCSDGVDVVIGANSDTLFHRLATVMGKTEFLNEKEYGNNALRVERVEEIYKAISDWTRKFPSLQVIRDLDTAGIPNGKIYSIADISADTHVRQRGMIESVRIEDDVTTGPWSIEIPSVTPLLSQTPGCTRWPGRSEPGYDTGNILKQLLNYTDQQIAELSSHGHVVMAQNDPQQVK